VLDAHEASAASAAAVADGLGDPPPGAVAAHKLLWDGALHEICLLCRKKMIPQESQCQRGGGGGSSGSIMQRSRSDTRCLILAVVGP
jgi:hypothetical protein